MISNLIGAAIGRAIDRRDGGSGTTGAVIGAVGTSVLKRLVPLAIAAGGAYALWSAFRPESEI